MYAYFSAWLQVSGFFCLLFAVVVYNRLEFTLTK